MEENKKIKINEIEIKIKFFWNRAIRAVHVFFNRSWSWKHCRRSQPTERFKNVSCGLTYRYFSLGRLFKIAFGRLFEKLSGRIRKVNFSWPRILENKELAYANHCRWKCDGGIRSVRRKNSTAVSCQNFYYFLVALHEKKKPRITANFFVFRNWEPRWQIRVSTADSRHRSNVVLKGWSSIVNGRSKTNAVSSSQSSLHER